MSGEDQSSPRIALQLDIHARPTRLFQALLAPDDLSQWFCPNVVTAPHRGGPYQFWGEESIASLYAEGQGGGPIYGLEAPQSLWYCWPIAGRITDVVFYLKASGGGTSLQLVHQGLPSGMMLMDFWHLRLYALRAYVEGRQGPGLSDYRARPIRSILHEALILASPREVFRALTDSSLVSQWMNAQAHVDPRLGGLYDLGWRDAQGYMAGPQEIIELIPEQSLAYRWQYGDETGAGDEVHITLVEEGGGTLVTFEHLGFDPDRDNRDYDQGWLQLLWSLKALVEEDRLPIAVMEGSWDL